MARSSVPSSRSVATAVARPKSAAKIIENASTPGSMSAPALRPVVSSMLSRLRRMTKRKTPEPMM
ncbi:hypothetical protein OIM90_10560 [Streptomyces sp. AD16]|nr:hypothetical protein OIM90_10560 [Streptomyces sp. AD16]